ncbi:DUF362 domain-containing protein [Carboxydothermus hydrogenoformans]|uniref:Ferredoxin n=1 Tax=Carboxydothermus hydrogenoformans (strain ATCC BAA-161 / DSM 6008 / Z-2901) TaxID=246194 RepID=Q3A9J0_CARHZ|nr:DUF362 domain-containing protein [Carboxydothermus hydrogenoformans]ABB14087.1 iron-sulfur cluster-binding protein [Carboxydothermus hydrogenoformans Z-2901]
MKVCAAKCSSYNYAEVEAAVAEVFSEFGGIETFIKPGERVLIKPNMLEGLPPERAVTTHPEVVRAVVRMVKKAGAIPLVGDSPGTGNTERVAARCGIARVCQEEGAELLPFAEAKDYPHPEGRTVKRFSLARELSEVDKVISVAKMKTHSFMGITGGIKNLFGFNVATTKAQYHLRMQKRDDFAAMLCDLALLIKPVFFIIDGVVGMEGNGPRNGNPKKAGVIIGGDSGFAVDMVMTQMMGFEAEKMPVARVALNWGVVVPLKEIEVTGSGKGLTFNFAPPNNIESLDGRIPAFLVRFFQNQFTARPVMNERCVGCGRCARHCPPKAVKIENRRAIVDYNKCIRCYCCQELCPANAVELKEGFLMRLFSRKK